MTISLDITVDQMYPQFKMKQQELAYPQGWGGNRKGAGRPRGGRVSHHPRPRFSKRTPVHVTLRMRKHVWNLRSQRAFRRIAKCLEAACGRLGLRVIEFSVLGNHLHLIVEADDHVALGRGMKGLNVRLARALNQMMGRGGPVFADHYDARLLRSPTQLVRAIAYVLRNHEHHFATKGADAYCSEAMSAEVRRGVLCLPLSWLLREGWRRASRDDLRRLAGTRYG